MLKASTPPRFNIAFAANAGGSFTRPIPQASQIGINPGFASLNDGFPPLTFQPVAAGGVPPFGADMNGILNQSTLWNQWFEAGAPIYYDATFASGASGGYPKGAIVQSSIVPGNSWLSTIDNNTVDPDSTSNSGQWVQNGILSGTPVPSFSFFATAGYVPSNTLTIGNASSNATNRANADTLLLYRVLWSLFSNTFCPIFTSAGVPSTRGANPDADFNANKALATLEMRGRGLIGVDTMGGPASTFLSGVPVQLGNTTTPGSTVGENLHTLSSTEVPNTSFSVGVSVSGVTGTMNQSDPHTHTTNAIFYANNFGVGTGATDVPGNNIATINATSVNHTHNFSGSGSGSGNINGGNGAHNNTDLGTTVFWNLKL
jgi:hypothetical protein